MQLIGGYQPSQKLDGIDDYQLHIYFEHKL